MDKYAHKSTKIGHDPDTFQGFKSEQSMNDLLSLVRRTDKISVQARKVAKGIRMYEGCSNPGQFNSTKPVIRATLGNYSKGTIGAMLKAKGMSL